MPDESEIDEFGLGNDPLKDLLSQLEEEIDTDMGDDEPETETADEITPEPAAEQEDVHIADMFGQMHSEYDEKAIADQPESEPAAVAETSTVASRCREGPALAPSSRMSPPTR